MSILDIIFKPLLKTLKQPIESFIRLETADSDYVLAAEDGSLVSILRVDGSYQIIGRNEYERIVSDAVVKFGTKFDKSGHAMQVYFARNPDLMKGKLQRLLEPSRAAAEGAGLEIGDIFDEKQRHLANFLASEEIYFVLWSRPSALTKSDMAREMERSRDRKWVSAPDAQYPFAGMESLRTKHTNFTSSITSSLNEVGIKSEMLEVHDALRAIRINLFQSNVNSAWSPCLPGDPIPARAPRKAGDHSEVLWPSVKYQLANYSARIVNDHIVEMGNYVWGGVDLVLAPQEPTPFPALLSRLNEEGIPFRMSYLIEGGGVEGMALQSFLTSILAVTNSTNKQIKNSIEGLSEMAKSEPIVKMRVSLATWAPRGQVEELENRISALIQSIESWGYCQASYVTGDPLDCVMSSAMGIACASTAPPVIAPLYEVLRLLPWQRGASPFRNGSILLRTADGRVWPYQTGTNLTTTWFDLVFAQPGGGKSVLMNSLNLGTCLSAGVAELPFIAVIDIGPSSSGLISLIRDALPPEKRQQAVSYRLQMSQEFAINPFDTKLGMRVPQTTERSFLIELLVLLCTPAGQSDPYDGIPQLASMVVDEMFRWRNDTEGNAEPRPYLPRVDHELDKIIAENKIELGESPYWWDVVDKLFDAGLTYEAGLAQRYAVPTLGDAVAAARRPQIRNLLKETKIGSGGEGVIHAFERMITSAVREFPILSTVTKFALNENRICALDLADVCPQGDATADRQTAIMYMLARHVLVTPWWINEEALVQMPPKYRPYHEQKLRDFAETPKRLCYDEFHRTSSSKSVRGQLVRDVREGRKRGVQIVLASQMLQDFDDDMVDLATGVWVLGAAISDSAIDQTQKTFGLTETARWIIRHRLTGPKASGAPCLFVLATTDGKYEQFLINTLGPIELWAFSTSSEDVAIRNRLYHRLGAAQGRKLLAQFYPGGSARNDIRRRVAILSEKGENIEKASVGAIIEQITDEITNFALERFTDFEEPSEEEREETNRDEDGDKRDHLRPRNSTKGVIGGVAPEEEANKGSTKLIEKTLEAAKVEEEVLVEPQPPEGMEPLSEEELSGEPEPIEEVANIEIETLDEPEPIEPVSLNEEAAIEPEQIDAIEEVEEIEEIEPVAIEENIEPEVIEPAVIEDIQEEVAEPAPIEEPQTTNEAVTDSQIEVAVEQTLEDQEQAVEETMGIEPIPDLVEPEPVEEVSAPEVVEPEMVVEEPQAVEETAIAEPEPVAETPVMEEPQAIEEAAPIEEVQIEEAQPSEELQTPEVVEPEVVVEETQSVEQVEAVTDGEFEMIKGDAIQTEYTAEEPQPIEDVAPLEEAPTELAIEEPSPAEEVQIEEAQPVVEAPASEAVEPEMVAEEPQAVEETPIVEPEPVVETPVIEEPQPIEDVAPLEEAPTELAIEEPAPAEEVQIEEAQPVEETPASEAVEPEMVVEEPQMELPTEQIVEEVQEQVPEVTEEAAQEPSGLALEAEPPTGEPATLDAPAPEVTEEAAQEPSGLALEAEPPTGEPATLDAPVPEVTEEAAQEPSGLALEAEPPTGEPATLDAPAPEVTEEAAQEPSGLALEAEAPTGEQVVETVAEQPVETSQYEQQPEQQVAVETLPVDQSPIVEPQYAEPVPQEPVPAETQPVEQYQQPVETQPVAEPAPEQIVPTIKGQEQVVVPQDEEQIVPAVEGEAQQELPPQTGEKDKSE